MAGATGPEGCLPFDPPPLILLVEAEKPARLEIAHQLLDQGCEVVEADHAGEALSILGGRSDVDAVIVDLDPGAGEGAALVEHIRRRQPRIAVLTLSREGEMRRDGLAGQTACLLKPVAGAVLVAELATVLALRQAEAVA